MRNLAFGCVIPQRWVCRRRAGTRSSGARSLQLAEPVRAYPEEIEASMTRLGRFCCAVNAARWACAEVTPGAPSPPLANSFSRMRPRLNRPRDSGLTQNFDPSGTPARNLLWRGAFDAAWIRVGADSSSDTGR